MAILSFFPFVEPRNPHPLLYRDAFAEVFQFRKRENLFVEVVLMDGINDSPELARELAALLRPLPARASINLLPYNDTGHAMFRASTREAVAEFQRILMEEGFVATIRTARQGRPLGWRCFCLCFRRVARCWLMVVVNRVHTKPRFLIDVRRAGCMPSPHN